MKNRKYTNRTYLDRLQEQVMIFDGAMGTNLQKQNLSAENFGGEKFIGCNDILTLTCPQAIEEVSFSFLQAGVDVIETKYLPLKSHHTCRIWTGGAHRRNQPESSPALQKTCR